MRIRLIVHENLCNIFVQVGDTVTVGEQDREHQHPESEKGQGQQEVLLQVLTSNTLNVSTSLVLKHRRTGKINCFDLWRAHYFQTFSFQSGVFISVADSDPGLGAFLTPGSGMGKSQHPHPGSGMNNPDHIF